MGVHDNHRERIRRRFLKSGESFEDYQLLEMLLFHSVPRADTNPTAHRLIKNFGGMREVLDAPVTELMKIEGVGERSAQLIKLAQRIAISYLEPDESKVIIIKDSFAAGEFLRSRFMGRREESIFALLLDAKGKLLCCKEAGFGNQVSSEVDFRAIVEVAISSNATGVILAHNHPSGYAVPSKADIDATVMLKNMMGAMNIELLDHLVFADDDFVSMKDSNLI